MGAYPWDYIDQMNGLLDSKLEELTPSELYLYMKLFQINNNKHRVEWFELKNRMLSAFIDKDEKSMIRLRNSLRQKGLIEFVSGKKGQPTQYRLVLLYGEKNPPKKNTGKNASKNASICASENASESASESASICASISASEKVSEPQCLCGVPDPLKGKGKGKEKGKEKNSASHYEKKPAFSPPTLQEVRDYVQGRSLPIDPDWFFEYYNAGDWHDKTGEPVRNWKQRCLAWAKREGEHSHGQIQGPAGKYAGKGQKPAVDPSIDDLPGWEGIE